MDSIKSFKGNGKVDEAEERTFKQKTRRRLIILIISVIVLLAVIIGAVAGTLIHKRNNSSHDAVPQTELTPSASLKAVCDVTRYPSSCFSSISSIASSNATDPEIIFKLSLKVAINELSKLSEYPNKLRDETKDTPLRSALEVCGNLFDDALDRLNDSAASLEDGKQGTPLSKPKIEDLKTWLSTTITDQETCLDALEELNSRKNYNATLFEEIKTAMQNSTEYASNSLAIVSKILGLLTDFNVPIHRRLLGFPAWVSPTERSLLQESKLTSHVIVAKDGSGQFLTINDAVRMIGKKNESRFVIYVKAGKYVENVILDKNKWNVMIYGDGKDKTTISGSLNFIDGTPTFATPTFAVAGRGFIAKDIKFENTAGAAKHQAVAMRSGSDRSVFYRCAFDAYQDTEGFLNPVGWREWVTNVDPPSTIFYEEYQNTGPGSAVDQRVKWAGFRSTLSEADAGKFTVATFIQGQDWLPDATVAFEPAL